jgi:hypothetical protein
VIDSHTISVSDPCKGNPCIENAECFVEDNQVKCKCSEGFVGQPGEKCWKIEINICDPNPCGPNTTCVTGSEPKCYCNENLYGKPPNCYKGCSDDEECKKGQYCSWFSKKCEIGCGSDESCEDNEYCDYNSCKNPCSDSPCGPNSICRSTKHSKSVKCSCEVGFKPIAGLGCQATSGDQIIYDKNLNCSQFCGKKAECELVKDKIECFCPEKPVAQWVLDPFEDCHVHPGGGYAPGIGHCYHANKPECAVLILPHTIAILAG